MMGSSTAGGSGTASTAGSSGTTASSADASSSSRALFTHVTEEEPNNSIAEGQANGPFATTNYEIAGAISVVGDVDYFGFLVQEGQSVRLETSDGTPGSCTGVDTILHVYTTAGALVQTLDNGGVGGCSRGVISPAAGTYFVAVSAALASDTIPSYLLDIEYP